MQLAQGVGVQGFIVDGVIRDLAAARTIDFPSFLLERRQQQVIKWGGAVGVPVSVGGVVVQTGDIIVGDIDGVIVVPAADAERIAEGAEAKVAKDEVREQEALANGEESIRVYLKKVVK